MGELALVPYFDCVLVPTLAADPNAFRIIAGIAERRCAAGSDPFVAALMPSLLFLNPLFQRLHDLFPGARKSVVVGKSVSVGVDMGGRRIIKKKKTKIKKATYNNKKK